MNLYIFRQEALIKLADSIPDNIAQYSESSEPWIEEFFRENNVRAPLFNSELNVEVPELVSSDPSSDFENSVLVHNMLHNQINSVQAADRRLWIALTHTVFYDYMIHRWPVENMLNDKGTNGTVTDRYFASRGLFRNGIARLFWIPEITYDEENEESHYLYTEYLVRRQDLINQIEGRSLCKNKMNLKATLKVLMDDEMENPNDILSETQRRRYYENLCKYGGVKVLDALPPQRMEDLCRRALDRVRNTGTVTDGSKVVLRSPNTGFMMEIDVINGKAYNGKTLLQTKPRNLYRLSVGKELEIGKARYVISEIR